MIIGNDNTKKEHKKLPQTFKDTEVNFNDCKREKEREGQHFPRQTLFIKGYKIAIIFMKLSQQRNHFIAF